ncbi:hypothetical protein [Filimonas effusa]|uniref:Uncharacterized protein n=1 Tax=Filimonas effusa TaxID=2508721 RepID=A0A4Q1D5R0_9BACT|nr:hypothetical protein [Filimonas effusa]RXK83892.1 hypothetical protein ESB13_17635 [Filimonas effusa]
MVETLKIHGKDVWVVVEPQETGHGHTIPAEYFTAYYNLEDPGAYSSTHEPGKEPGKPFKDEHDEPKKFLSPVEAMEYAAEQLPAMLNS